MSTFRIFRRSPVLFLFAALLLATTLRAQVPEWIWHSNNGKAPVPEEVRYLRKTFSVEGKVNRATLAVAVDDEADVWLNGNRITTHKGWQNASYTDITRKIKPGQNVLAMRVKNVGGDAAAALVQLELVARRDKHFIVSDTSWQSSAVLEDGWEKLIFEPSTNWRPVVSRGKHGIQPWGEVLKQPQATRAEDIATLANYKVELLRSAQPQEGSWICMTIDPKGRLIISSQQDDLPFLRVTLSASGKMADISPFPIPVHQAMGLCWAHDSLYANAHGPNGTGLYRLIDKNKNDHFETNECFFLKKIEGEGEHGYHAVVEGPDGMIYVMNGNHTKLPKDIVPDSPHQNWQEDLLLPRQWDAGGHAVGILAPGGHVLRTDPDGKKWELVFGGFRNSYDFDFNKDGEIFTYDSDMEWEWGMPWYRPTRIIHCVTAGDYGWRSGSAKWPEYYPDGLPATDNISIGSPTGVKFGTKSNFPEKYKAAFYAMDWSYGRIWAVHLQPKGASYTAEHEVFIKGKPLNVTDLEFGKNGAMYFITGGRATQSGLYRVSYVGPRVKETRSESARLREEAAKNYRQLRRLLEAFHGKKDPEAIEVAWPFLGHEDRFIRYAARVAIESQDVSLWKDRAVKETNARAGLNALLALARVGGKETQNDLLLALKQFPFDSLTGEQRLEKLRVIELSFTRQGKPDSQLTKLAMEKLSRIYPSESYEMNKQLCQLLVFLEAPDVVEKTFVLFDKAKTQEEQIHYLFVLRSLKTGWTIEQREKYFKSLNAFITQAKASDRHPEELLRWFKEADRDYADGASYTKQLNNMKKDAITTLNEDEKLAIGDLIGEATAKTAEQKPAKEHKFVKEWKMEDLEPALETVGQGRDFEKGKAAFNDAQCILCHRFGNEGGAVGPELTAASSKYSRRDILDSILAPSKVVSEQFENLTVVKKDGDDVTGRVVDENDEKIVLLPNPLEPTKRVEVKKSEIAQRKPSKLSPMPEGLLNNFTREEIVDLLAYIESMGKKNAANFKKGDRAEKR